MSERIDRFYYLTFEKELYNPTCGLPRKRFEKDSYPQKIEVLIDFVKLCAIKSTEYVKTDKDGVKLPPERFVVELVMEHNTTPVEDVPLSVLEQLKATWMAWIKQNPEFKEKKKD